jgi:hypothetical protein
MLKRQPFTIGNVSVMPHEHKVVQLAIPRLYDMTEMSMPVHIIHGRRPGPVLFVSAAIHGDEIDGIQIVRKLLQLKLLTHLRGTLVAIPLVNTYGFLNRMRYLPDRRDLNRSFPGNDGGSLASRLASLFFNEIVKKCTHGIDLHSGSNFRANLPQTRVTTGDETSLAMARAFNAPVILHARLREGSLRAAASACGIPVITYETGESLRFSEQGIRLGVKGIQAVMRHLEMLPKAPPHRRLEALEAQQTFWVRAPVSGLLFSKVKLGMLIEKNQSIGRIENPMNAFSQELFARRTGMVIGRSNLPLVYQGDALFNVAAASIDELEATFEDMDSNLGTPPFDYALE